MKKIIANIAAVLFFCTTAFITGALASTTGWAPESLTRIHAVTNVTNATFPEDLGPGEYIVTQSDFNSGNYSYTRLTPNSGRLTYSRFGYTGTVVFTLTGPESGTFRDDFVGPFSGFASGTFEVVSWDGVFPSAIWYESAATLNDGWRFFDWFKGFRPGPDNWIFHGRHGWMFVQADNTQGMFLWDVAMRRWLWTNETVYPWMYAYGPGEGWVFFFEGGRPGSRWFRRGDTGQLVSEQGLRTP